MGYIRHNAILVTGCAWEDKDFACFHEQIRDVVEKHGLPREMVSDLFVGINSYTSFAVFPDGSKEGWDTSDDGDDARAEVVELFRTVEPKKQVWFNWCEIEFGGDGDSTIVVDDGKPKD